MELYLHDIKLEHKNPKGKGFETHSYVNIFASDDNGIPVFVEVKNFKPWIYLELKSADDFETFKSQCQEEFWFRNVVFFEMVKRKRFVGFSDNKLFDYVLVRFTGLIPMYCGRKKLRETNPEITIYEDKVDPVLKFFHETKVRPSSYFRIENYTKVFGSGVSHCETEYKVSVTDIHPVLEDHPPPPLVTCAYDIESSGLNPKNDYVFQVSLCFSKLGESLEDPDSNTKDVNHASSACKDGMVICVGETESLDGTPIVSVKNEQQLLEKFRDVIIERKVSILIGFNSYQFDGQFMYKRAVDTYKMDSFRKIGLIRDELAELKVRTLQSSALGTNELSQFVIPGRIEFDAYMTLKRNQKLSSYKLNYVCEKYFGGTKDDITYQDILEACTSKDPHKLGVIAKYCYQDSWLVLRLVDKLKDIYNGMQMSKLCVVPLSFIESRGQQIKCLSLILDKIHGEYVCNYVSKEETGGQGFQGATVIDATKGFHVTDPVVCLDFASLYPSIMRWKNLCYTTYVNDDSFKNIDGVHYEEYETSPGNIETFAHRPGEKGILSRIEEDLGEARKATKKLMKGSTGFKYDLLNSKQLAQKVTMNSLYGFCGTVRGSLPLVAIAAAVTCTGRDMIVKTAEFVRNVMGATVVYGDTDSVMVTFPVSDALRDQGDKALLKNAYEKGLEAEEKASALFGHPVLLEYEKIFFPFLLLSKKRYATMCYMDPDKEPKMTSSGLVTIRRDNAPFVRKCANEVISLLMAKKTEKDVVGYITSVLDDLQSGKIPVEDLIISKELKKHPENYASPVPHAVLSGKIRERAKNQKIFREIIKPFFETEGGFNDRKLCETYSKLDSLRRQLSFKEKTDLPMEKFVDNLAKGRIGEKYGKNDVMSTCESLAKSPEARLVQIGIHNSFDLGQNYRKFSSFDKVFWEEPRLGDRIPYVVLRGPGNINDRVEDPKYFEKCTYLKLDILYYIDQQLKNPIVGIIEHVFSDPESIFSGFARRANNANQGRREITSFFERNVKSKN